MAPSIRRPAPALRLPPEKRAAQSGTFASDGPALTQQAAHNIRTVVALEEATRARATATERLIDRIAWIMARPVVIASHLIWFGTWLALNRGAEAFDPYPFSLLTLVVSLEAILLTMFLLIAQNRMSALAERRAHLDLQINLLAEQELTAILRVLCRLADKAEVDISNEPALAQFRTSTDVSELADILDDALKAPAEAAPSGK